MKMLSLVWMTLAVGVLPLFPGFAPLHGVEHRNERDQKELAWVDSVFNSLTEQERLGQLFMVAAYPKNGEGDLQALEKTIYRWGIGGVIFFQGQPSTIAHWGNRLQATAKTPLLFAIDGEWGVSMRVDSAVVFPRQLMLGAIRDERLIYDFGAQVAQECKHLGIHINFAPVIDVNNNANNPVIGDRSFGENKHNVAHKGTLYMAGMQQNGVLACGKHFPGHGDTDVDSHHDLPIILHSADRLDSLEMFPFKVLSQQGLGAVMIAHLSIPALDPSPRLPSTLSKPIVQGWLKDSIGFEGLVITDAMNMQGVAKYYMGGVAELLALQAGADIILMPQNVEAALSAAQKALAKGELDRDDLDNRVRKVLTAKYRAGLSAYRPVNTIRVGEKLQSMEAQFLKTRLIRAGLTLVRNEEQRVPLTVSPNERIASWSVGVSGTTSFQSQLARFAPVKSFFSGAEVSSATVKELATYSTVIVSLQGMSRSAAKSFGLTTSARNAIKELAKKTKVILVVFGSPYALRFFDDLPTVLVAYENDALVQQCAAEALFGSANINGRLPITASERSRCGMGELVSVQKMPRGDAESLGMNAARLNDIDAIAQEGISQGAYPGCEVLVARRGKIIYQKTFGYQTYENITPIEEQSIFDVASVTKICATTIALMRLYEEGKFDLNQTMGHYLPELIGTNKQHLVMLDVLLHQARLTPWIPFYEQTLSDTKQPSEQWYRKESTGDYNVAVAEGLFMHQAYVDSIFHLIAASDLRDNNNYRYSDVGLILLTRVIERVSGKPLDRYVDETFYQPMGLRHTGFNLWQTTPKELIVPTENDDYFRHQKLQGYVHDMAAAMMGGVSGHAGLFSTAEELAMLLQMLLNGGTYNGIRYLKPETVQLFTKQYSSHSRRGIGFDKPEPDQKKSVNTAYQCSPETFGHTGFTGISAWADPREELIYIFLSNRTYPTMRNDKFIKLDIRTRIQEKVYEALEEN